MPVPKLAPSKPSSRHLFAYARLRARRLSFLKHALAFPAVTPPVLVHAKLAHSMNSCLIRIGTASIKQHACMGARGLGCSSCVEHCPVPDAIRLERGVPVINADICTGCGHCADICPAPERAIMILPTLKRPLPSYRFHYTC